MAFEPPEHDLHRRRFGRNLGVGLLLGAFVVLTFLLTIEKVTYGDPMKAIRGQGVVQAPDQASGAAP